MGVSGFWSDFTEIPSTTLFQWSVGFLERRGRLPMIAIDMSQSLFEIKDASSSWGSSNFHRIFIRKLVGFLVTGYSLVGVFDGDVEHRKLRHGPHSCRRTNSPAITFMRECCDALGIAVVQAPGEAEAQCAYMQAQGLVDAVFSSDADVFCFGATVVLRYFSTPGQSRTRFSDTQNATHREIKVVDLMDTDTPSQCQLSYAFRALLQGNDFDKGIGNLGEEYARRIASRDLGFVRELETIMGAEPDARQELVCSFVQRLTTELTENTSGFFKKKKTNVQFPPDFPNLKILEIFLNPTIITTIPQTHLIQRQPNLAALAALWLSRSPCFSAPPAQPKEKKRVKTTTPENDLANTAIGAWYVFKILSGTDDINDVHRIGLEKNGLCDVEFAKSVPMFEHISQAVKIPSHIIDLSHHSLREKRSPHYVRGNMSLDSFFVRRMSRIVLKDPSLTSIESHRVSATVPTPLSRGDTPTVSSGKENRIFTGISSPEVIDLCEPARPVTKSIRGSLKPCHSNANKVTSYFSSSHNHKLVTRKSPTAHSTAHSTARGLPISRPIPALRTTSKRGIRKLPSSKLPRVSRQPSIEETLARRGTLTIPLQERS